MCSGRTRNEKKKRQLRQRVSHLPGRTVVLFEDETYLVLFPPLRAGWAKRGETVSVVLCGANARRVVYGVISVATGRRFFLPCRRQRAAEFQEFLRLVRNRYRGWKIIMILDMDSSHTAQASQRLAAALDIELLWLPVRCPELNPMEGLWRMGKQQVCANRQYVDIDQQAKRFVDYLKALPSYEALVKSGVLSGNFWLWKK